MKRNGRSEMKDKLKMVPEHIAIIMDGNGRWAKRKGLPRIAGHREGLKAVRAVVKAARKYGVKYLTLYSFSTENWKRPEDEVRFLFHLMEERLRKEGQQLDKNNVKVSFIGKKDGLPAKLVKTMGCVERHTFKNTGLTLIFAINYGSRQEITDAVKRIISSGEKDITEDLIEKNLYTVGIPAPDLIIRTSGEKRLSNFLLWQAAYAELYFTHTLWPDFKEDEFLKALFDYQRRKRRFGGLSG
ncbi:MAG: isoprenyl transferase [Candidatus Omnitrophica bacterium]|nr:isoprenyl transferase [Candidatus Omnitrophota bacterium]